jgi:hypothetical protein
MWDEKIDEIIEKYGTDKLAAELGVSDQKFHETAVREELDRLFNIPAVERFFELADSILGESDYRRMDDYSGRGMYGEVASAAVISTVKSELFRELTSCRSDQLGLGMVYYIK